MVEFCKRVLRIFGCFLVELFILVLVMIFFFIVLAPLFYVFLLDGHPAWLFVYLPMIALFEVLEKRHL